MVTAAASACASASQLLEGGSVKTWPARPGTASAATATDGYHLPVESRHRHGDDELCPALPLLRA